jgi:hypothetical protein
MEDAVRILDVSAQVVVDGAVRPCSYSWPLSPAHVWGERLPWRIRIAVRHLMLAMLEHLPLHTHLEQLTLRDVRCSGRRKEMCLWARS